nr:unnamed protein product [Callosobruchus analis]
MELLQRRMLIKDPTAMCESVRNIDYFHKEAGNRLTEVNGAYVYKHSINAFLLKLEMFVRSKWQQKYQIKCKPCVHSYLLEYLPYRQNEVLAFVKMRASDWTGVAFALAHIMPEKDVAQLETHLKICQMREYLTGLCVVWIVMRRK